MTPEEQVRMNELCAAIQEERNYERFAAVLHEMSELIARKEQRRFPDQPKIVWARNKPWTSMSASAKKLLPSVGDPKGRVEISIPQADDLFREIRIANQLTSVDGQPVALAAGAHLTLTLEAEDQVGAE
jgi:hypothetical protein